VLSKGTATCTIGDAPALATVPMYRAYNPNAAYHFFTTSLGELNNSVSFGYNNESTPVPFSVSNVARPGTSAIFRMYNPNNGRHYYTSSTAERDFLANAGWNYEKDEGFIFTSAEPGTTEIFRLYNTIQGVHLYTKSAGEKDTILGSPSIYPGWTLTTSIGYAFP
jgi:hypothetical protein